MAADEKRREKSPRLNEANVAPAKRPGTESGRIAGKCGAESAEVVGGFEERRGMCSSEA